MDGVYALTGKEPDEDMSAQPDGQEAQEGPVKLLRHVQQHADFYRVMLGSKGDPAFTERFRQNTERRFRTWVEGSVDPNAPPLDLRITCHSYAGVGAIRWWLEHSQQTSPEQLARWLSQLSTSMMGSIVKPK
jgi:hypothetical protein